MGRCVGRGVGSRDRWMSPGGAATGVTLGRAAYRTAVVRRRRLASVLTRSPPDPRLATTSGVPAGAGAQKRNATFTLRAPPLSIAVASA
jgi:hypothetical protein